VKKAGGGGVEGWVCGLEGSAKDLRTEAGEKHGLSKSQGRKKSGCTGKTKDGWYSRGNPNKGKDAGSETKWRHEVNAAMKARAELLK